MVGGNADCISREALLSIGLLIVGAKLLEGAFKRFGLNSIIAFAVTGAILGPVTGLVEPAHDLDLILSIGIFMFFFLIGLEELDIRGFLAAIRGRLFIAATLSVAISMVASLAVTTDIVIDLGLHLSLTEALGLAGVLSLSSLGVAAKALIDEGSLRERVGVQIFTAVIIAELIALSVVGFTISEHFYEGGHGDAPDLQTIGTVVAQILGFAILTWLFSTKVLPRIIVVLHNFLQVPQLSFGVAVGWPVPGCRGSGEGRIARFARRAALWRSSVRAAVSGEARHYAGHEKRGRGILRAAVFCVSRPAAEL